MTRTWAAYALDLIAKGEPAAMVTLAAVQGSAPREAGTRMIVGLSGIFGTVGGGNLEHLLIDQARRLASQSDIDVSQQDYPLGPLLAQCCGGRVRVLIERLGAGSRNWLSVADKAEQAGRRYTLAGEVAGGRIGREITEGWSRTAAEGAELFDASGPAGPKAAWTRIVEYFAPIASDLHIFGAGHVGTAIVHIAQTLPFRLHWFDGRAELAGVPTLTIREDLVTAAIEAPPSTFFLVLTHAHELDYQLVRAILSRNDARYCGLIGSDTKRARFLSRLAKDNVDASGLTCPIGAGGIRSKDPAAIAVSACAELLLRLEAAANSTLASQRVAS
ncbi:MAG: xanthine dehydrogenase accessory protein XdhC [Hyphomonadaceae bacterium]|nr:xanthine dehydrogenase accessory protein XdhC [Hyphomonadaceae bacterium]